MMKALVTGGAGFIGSNLAEAIIDKYDVTVLDNFHTGSISLLDQVRKDITVIKGSCSDCLAMRLSPDVIYHLGIPSEPSMYRSNPLLMGEAMNSMAAIMELARKSGTRKVIIASTSSLYDGQVAPHREDATIQATDYYTEANLAMERVAELYHRLYGTNYIALRLFSIYGPHERSKGSYASEISQLLWSMKAGQAPAIYGDGTEIRDFIAVFDVTEAMVMAAWRGTGVFNVGTGRPTSLNQVIDLLNAKLGTNLKPEYREPPIRNFAMHTLADTAKMKALGFEAKYSLEKGIDVTLEHG